VTGRSARNDRRTANAGSSGWLAAGDPACDPSYDEPIDHPYATVGPTGTTEPFADSSPLVQAMDQPLTFRRLHVNPKWRDLAAAAVDETAG
jgi:hypothetical protein